MINIQIEQKFQVNKESFTEVLLVCINSLTSGSEKITSAWEFAETL